MSYIVVPSRRLRQPQGAVRVNWSNQLTQELKVATLGTSPTINLASGRGVVAANGVGARAGASGLGISWGSTGSAGIRVNSTTELTSGFSGSTTGISVFVLANPSSSTTRYIPFTTAEAAQPEFDLIFNAVKAGTASAGSFAITTYGSNGADAASVVNGRDRLFGAVFNNPISTPYLYVDGVDVGVNKSISAGALCDSGCSDYVGGYLSTGYAASGFAQYLTVAWNRALSDVEVAEFTRYPWSIFVPDPRRLYFGAGATGERISFDLPRPKGTMRPTVWR